MKRLLHISLAAMFGWILASGTASAQEASPGPRLIPVQAPGVESAPYSITPLTPGQS